MQKILHLAIEKRHLSKFTELRQFFLFHGHCYVPLNKEYNALYEWTQTVRQSRLSLSKELVAELESMGFDWIMYNAKDLFWQSMYYELKLFKQQTGHCRVSEKGKDNPSLGRWVSRQRRMEMKMPKYRRKLLNEISFYWRADMKRYKALRWWDYYVELVEFWEGAWTLPDYPKDCNQALVSLGIKAKR